MLKALFKKQFLELNAFYFQDRKTGKLRSKVGVLGYVALFLFFFVSVAMAFLGVSDALSAAFLPLGLDWLYFAMIGMMAIAVGTLGSVFNTYAGLYHAKDNEMLLSMPIPTAYILLVRMGGVYLTALLYSALVWVPTVFRYFAVAKPSPSAVLFSVLMLFVLALFVTVLTCALGFVVAKIAAHLKNKSLITVLCSLLFLGGYYFVYFRANAMLAQVAAHTDQIAATVRTWIYPAYQMGLAASGNGLSMLACTAVVLILFALCVFLMAHGFLKIVTAGSGTVKTKYVEKNEKNRSVDSALLRKEFRRLTASPTYMLNCGMGLILLPVAAVFALIRKDILQETLSGILQSVPQFAAMLPIMVLSVVCIGASANDFTAPSVSLEGKTIWIAQSLPIAPWQVLRAKIRMHILLCIFPTVLCAVLLGIALKTELLIVLLTAVVVALYVCFMAMVGLVLNLWKPNLTWTNEAVPVKQSFSVAIALLGGSAVSLLFSAVYYFVPFIPVPVYLLLLAVLLATVTLLLRRLIRRKGAEIFASL